MPLGTSISQLLCFGECLHAYLAHNKHMTCIKSASALSTKSQCRSSQIEICRSVVALAARHVMDEAGANLVRGTIQAVANGIASCQGEVLGLTRDVLILQPSVRGTREVWPPPLSCLHSIRAQFAFCDVGTRRNDLKTAVMKTPSPLPESDSSAVMHLFHCCPM